MVLSWFSGGVAKPTVADLIARKKYDKALELLREEFKRGSRDPRLRMQMADVLVMAGRGKESVPILVGLADEYAQDGFAAKAIALFKKIEKIDPGHTEVQHKLAQLIQEKPATIPLRPVSRDEELDLGATLRPMPSPFAEAPQAAPEAAAPPPVEEPVSERPAPLPLPTSEGLLPEGALLASLGEDEEDIPMSEDAFRDQLVGVLQDALVAPAPESGEAPEPADEGPTRSPLFSDFSEAELLAVMEGLRLLMYDPGDIIITQDEPGDSLFVLTTGRVKAFIRNPQGRHVQVREMEEGSFFGEIALLSGKPRTATVTAGSHCELLELDRATLDRISATHPRVLSVLEHFYQERVGSAADRQIRGSDAR